MFSLLLVRLNLVEVRAREYKPMSDRSKKSLNVFSSNLVCTTVDDQFTVTPKNRWLAHLDVEVTGLFFRCKFK